MSFRKEYQGLSYKLMNSEFYYEACTSQHHTELQSKLFCCVGTGYSAIFCNIVA